jgi:hypothetical protein
MTSSSRPVRISDFRINFPHQWNDQLRQPHLVIISKGIIAQHLDQGLSIPYSVGNLQNLCSWWQDVEKNMGLKQRWLLSDAVSFWWSKLNERTFRDMDLPTVVRETIHTICEDKRSADRCAKTEALRFHPNLAIEGLVYPLE